MDYSMAVPSKFAILRVFKDIITGLEENHPTHEYLTAMRYGYGIMIKADDSWFNGVFANFEASSKEEFDAKIYIRFAMCQRGFMAEGVTKDEQKSISDAKDQCEFILKEFYGNKVNPTKESPIKVDLKAGYIDNDIYYPYAAEMPNKVDSLVCYAAVIANMKEYVEIVKADKEVSDALLESTLVNYSNCLKIYEYAAKADESWFGGTLSSFKAKTAEEAHIKIATRFMWCKFQEINMNLSVQRREKARHAAAQCDALHLLSCIRTELPEDMYMLIDVINWKCEILKE